MEFFAMPYLVMFHDTMAYGSHHFITNFKFQCLIREHLLFEKALDLTTPEGKKEFSKLILLTQQGYCRNLAPVNIGEKVAILLSVEEPTLSTVRFCFRVIRYDGTPVTCGFQSIVCVSSDTGAIVPAPSYFLQFGTRMMERLNSPSFVDRIIAGRTMEVFDDAVIAMAVAVANSEPELSYPRFVTSEDHAVVTSLPAAVAENFSKGIVFMFPGQGSYSPSALKEIYHADAEIAIFLQKADKIAKRILGSSILKLIFAETPDSHDALLSKSPDMSQIGMYLGSVLSAQYLMKRGVSPDCVVGHSAGELAALAVAGVYSAETGVEIICNRIRALHSMKSEPAVMLAVFCDEARARSLITEMGEHSLQIVIVNHSEQTVISGTYADIQLLESKLENLGIRAVRLKSRYPFHSSLLEAAVAPFESFLKNINFASPKIPVYSPIEQGFYAVQPDTAHHLASHLIRPFAFPDALVKIFSAGGRTFIECGGGNVLSKRVSRVLAGREGIKVYSPIAPRSNAVDGLNTLVAAYADGVNTNESQSTDNTSDMTKVEIYENKLEPELADVPVAIVSMGCVLPGAGSPEEFWRNILEGRSGISDAGELRPEMVRDFLSQGEVVPDKTYTLLGGFVRNVNFNHGELPYSEQEFSRMSSAQRFLSVALKQCLDGLSSGIPKPERIHVYLGSTGDGVVEYDEALLFAGLRHEIDRIPATRESREIFQHILEKTLGRTMEDIHDFAPHASYCSVVEKFIGEGSKVIGVDAACASSLYAIDLGISALTRGECDVAFCGGVFAPGPANSCLYSQFRGLSATGSRPLDSSADGVVFGEGAALLMLKRLSDAVSAGDRIHAVIRGSGLSNDGKSPSVAVPRKHGQILALQRTYKETGIQPDSVQYIEAHATATPVGDTEEFGAMKEFFSAYARHSSIEWGSVKALIGHTGWLAGSASVIKMTEALKAKLIPSQSNFTAPNPNFDINGSPFRISTESRPWQQNVGNEPRRAGINGFGFGGSNAHVLMEEYVPAYHNRCREKALKPSIRSLSVVGLGALFSFEERFQKDNDQVLQFEQDSLKLPKGFMILPDVSEHMDKAQFLAFLAAHESLKGLGDKWKSLKSSIGVVLGVEGKTGLGISANKRIYTDFLERRLNELAVLSGISPQEFSRIKDNLLASLRTIQPSGPYTLPGLMPNVTAGRVGNLLDLNGPNFVIDSGNLSLFESLSTAETLLSAGKAQIVLAGGINGHAGPEVQLSHTSWNKRGKDRPVAEGAIVLALARQDFAFTHKLPVLAEVRVLSEENSDALVDAIVVGEGTPYCLKGAEGAIEIIKAIGQISDGQKPVDLMWTASNNYKQKKILRISAPGVEALKERNPMSTHRLTATERIDATYPVYFCTPRLTESEMGAADEPLRVQKGRVMILTDQTSWQEDTEAKAILNELEPTILCPAFYSIPNALPVNLSSEESIAESLKSVDFNKYDSIIAIKDISETPPLDGVINDGGSGEGLLDLVFAVVQ